MVVSTASSILSCVFCVLICCCFKIYDEDEEEEEEEDTMSKDYSRGVVAATVPSQQKVRRLSLARRRTMLLDSFLVADFSIHFFGNESASTAPRRRSSVLPSLPSMESFIPKAPNVLKDPKAFFEGVLPVEFSLRPWYLKLAMRSIYEHPYLAILSLARGKKHFHTKKWIAVGFQFLNIMFVDMIVTPLAAVAETQCSNYESVESCGYGHRLDLGTYICRWNEQTNECVFRDPANSFITYLVLVSIVLIAASPLDWIMMRIVTICLSKIEERVTQRKRRTVTVASFAVDSLPRQLSNRRNEKHERNLAPISEQSTELSAQRNIVDAMAEARRNVEEKENSEKRLFKKRPVEVEHSERKNVNAVMSYDAMHVESYDEMSRKEDSITLEERIRKLEEDRKNMEEYRKKKAVQEMVLKSFSDEKDAEEEVKGGTEIRTGESASTSPPSSNKRVSNFTMFDRTFTKFGRKSSSDDDASPSLANQDSKMSALWIPARRNANANASIDLVSVGSKSPKKSQQEFASKLTLRPSRRLVINDGSASPFGPRGTTRFKDLFSPLRVSKASGVGELVNVGSKSPSSLRGREMVTTTFSDKMISKIEEEEEDEDALLQGDEDDVDADDVGESKPFNVLPTDFFMFSEEASHQDSPGEPSSLPVSDHEDNKVSNRPGHMNMHCMSFGSLDYDASPILDIPVSTVFQNKSVANASEQGGASSRARDNYSSTVSSVSDLSYLETKKETVNNDAQEVRYDEEKDEDSVPADRPILIRKPSRRLSWVRVSKGTLSSSIDALDLANHSVAIDVAPPESDNDLSFRKFLREESSRREFQQESKEVSDAEEKTPTGEVVAFNRGGLLAMDDGNNKKMVLGPTLSPSESIGDDIEYSIRAYERVHVPKRTHRRRFTNPKSTGGSFTSSEMTIVTDRRQSRRISRLLSGFTVAQDFNVWTLQSKMMLAARLYILQRTVDEVPLVDEARKVALLSKADGYWAPHTTFQKIEHARETADKIKRQLRGIKTDMLMERHLMKWFLTEQITNPWKRRVAHQHFFQMDEHDEKDVSRFRWNMSFCALIMYLVFTIFYIFYFGMTLRGKEILIWVVVLIVSFLEVNLLILPAIIWFKFVFASAAAIDAVWSLSVAIQRKVHHVVRRTRGVLKCDQMSIQHVNPACRAARSYPHLSVSRLLIGLNDYDVCKENLRIWSTKDMLLYPIVTLSVIFTFLLHLFPKGLQELIIASTCIIVINLLFISLLSIEKGNAVIALVLVITAVLGLCAREMVAAQERRALNNRLIAMETKMHENEKGKIRLGRL